MRAAHGARATRAHSAAILMFAALAVAWTWPLARHLGDALPGAPGDNYSFVWNLWWMRYTLRTGAAYFHTTHVFYPFGTSLANHPHTALPALVAATLLRRWTPVEAQNLLLVFDVFANLACMYALAWQTTRHGRASVLAAIVFGLSPYVAVHLTGHFDLVAAWTLPLYALALGAAIRGRARTVESPAIALAASGVLSANSRTGYSPQPNGVPARLQSAARLSPSALAAGAVLGATAYVAYYHLVYLCFFTIVYALTAAGALSVHRTARAVTPLARRLAAAAFATAALCGAAALAIAASGGGTVSIAGVAIAAHAPQNALTAMWLAFGAALIVRYPHRLRVVLNAGEAGHAAGVLLQVAGAFALIAAPLVVEAAHLVARSEYVTPAYGWRSVPRGIDLIAPLLGHPLHPLFHRLSAAAYARLHQDYVETIGWFGLVPLALLVWSFTRWNENADSASTVGSVADSGRTALEHQESIRSDRLSLGKEARAWRAAAVVFAVWALGPFLTVAGFDTGLKLPALLLRYVPFVANARMPGRAVVLVSMAAAMLISRAVATAGGRWRAPALQWLLIAAVAFEYWDAPLTLTAVDSPAVYASLARAEAGAVCEVPFGIGDGLSTGIGSQDRRVLLDATIHEHPLVGGYIGRMPADAAARYAGMPVVSTLLALSSGATSLAPAAPSLATTARATPDLRAPCRYLVVRRSASSPALLHYVAGLHAERLATDEDRELYRLW